MHLRRALLLLTFIAATARAQTTSDNPHFATRESLEARAVAAESALAAASSEELREARRADAWALRERLRAGDFHPGDRVALVVEGHATMSDTFTVRTGKTLLIPDLPEIALAGVLRAELHDHLTREIGRFVREPKIRVSPLMRVAVLGNVGRPGFYGLPADALLSDAIMLAGGPAPDADLARSTVRRAAERLFGSGDVSAALSNGMTLDQLDIRAGDEIIIGEKRNFNLMTAIQTIGVASSLLLALFAANRAF
jgi:hypothetical protein